MGAVYAATEPGSLRRIAVKLMHRRGYCAGDDRRADAWLHNEARALSQLSHPNVVRIDGVGSHEGRPYMAMELVDGQTLSAWVDGSPRGWEQTLDVCIQAARGVAAAHSSGLLHGDIKPDNIMVAHDGRVLVMDFGLSRPMSAAARAPTQTALPVVPELNGDSDEGSDEGFDLEHIDPFLRLPAETTPRGRIRRRPGTPAYMAPELLAGVGGDARSDQFSLCVTLYRALFGRRPYGGRTPSQIAFRVSRNDLRMIPADVDVPVWVHASIVRGLTLDPAHRWQSVEAMLVQLERGRARHSLMQPYAPATL